MCTPLEKENAIYILRHDTGLMDSTNWNVFEAKRNRIQRSKCTIQVDPVLHWQNACAQYKNYTVYLTEGLRVLRFDHQTCEWSIIDLAEI